MPTHTQVWNFSFSITKLNKERKKAEKNRIKIVKERS